MVKHQVLLVPTSGGCPCSWGRTVVIKFHMYMQRPPRSCQNIYPILSYALHSTGLTTRFGMHDARLNYSNYAPFAAYAPVSSICKVFSAVNNHVVVESGVSGVDSRGDTAAERARGLGRRVSTMGTRRAHACTGLGTHTQESSKEERMTSSKVSSEHKDDRCE
ncbi:hypothetical protein B0T13DRAFT_294413 [Neurospora crassa]|nr:hypothetical protein B0T13DRAFT_294413 [Neurospora crassa]